MSDFLLDFNRNNNGGVFTKSTQGDPFGLPSLQEVMRDWKNSIPMNLANVLPEHMTIGTPLFSVKKTNAEAMPGKILGIEVDSEPMDILFIGKNLLLSGVVSLENPMGQSLFGQPVGQVLQGVNLQGKPAQIEIKTIKDPDKTFLEKIVASLPKTAS